eukprot:TRINITY_DN12724_c0_g1_i1.p1 TRINITY_DN12724_c0_g1~~TRINITY_DN12724_c0_g1_i1.p1  ORF type:complete len:390 (-),score=57.42 TRINITY_DN12724_c0_g1_i1:78-1247(-)
MCDPPLASGLWPLVAYMNHSCRPNVHRNFVGDLVVCRASVDMKAGTELVDTYTTLCQPALSRQVSLSRYGFTCDCLRCKLENHLLPVADAKLLVDKVDAVMDTPNKVNRKALKELFSSWEKVESKVRQHIRQAIQQKRKTLEQSLKLVALDLGGEVLEQLMFSSFGQVTMTVARIAKQLSDHGSCAEACSRIVSMLAALAPCSPQHALYHRWLALHSFYGRSPQVRARVQAAFDCQARCFGEQALQFQLELLQDEWPSELCRLASAVQATSLANARVGSDLSGQREPAPAYHQPIPTPGRQQPEKTREAWHSVCNSDDSCMTLTFTVPEGSIMSEAQVEVSETAIAITERGTRFEVKLPCAVNPAMASNRYSRRHGTLTIALPKWHSCR